MKAAPILCLVVLLGLNAIAFSQQPANDGFGSPQAITGALPQTIAGTTVGASAEFEEPAHARLHGPNVASKSVWYEWTATTDGFVLFETSGAVFDVVIAVYTGVALDALEEIGYSDLIFTGDEDIAIGVTAGTTYKVVVDGFGASAGAGEEGVFDLVVSELLVRGNDDFANADVLPSEFGLFLQDGRTAGASAEANEPQHAGQDASTSVWYRWTAPSDALVGVDVDALIDYGAVTGFDVAVAVYTGSDLTSLTEVGSADRLDRGIPERAVFEAQSGVEYRFAIDGVVPATEGRFWLEVLEVPLNDSLFDAEVLSTEIPVTVAGTTVNASSQYFLGEPDHAVAIANNLSSNSIWYIITPVVSGGLRVSVDGPTFDPVLAVYDDVDTGLREVAAADAGSGGISESLVFFAEAGIPYAIVVDDWAGNNYRTDGGTFDLTVEAAPPYEAWLTKFPSLTGAAAARGASPSGDGISNLTKLVLGLDPTIRLLEDPNRDRFPKLLMAGNGLTLRYTIAPENLGVGAEAIRHGGQISPDLQGWVPAVSSDTGDDEWSFEIPSDEGVKFYGRLLVEDPLP